MAIWSIVDPVNLDTLFGKRSGKADVVVVDLPVTSSMSPGKVVTLPISIAVTTGKGVLAYAFALNFDPNVLNPTHEAASTAGTLSEGWSIAVNSEIPGQITVTAYSTQELTGSGPLLNLNFPVTEPSSVTIPLKWTRFEVNENEIPSTLKPRLTVIEAAVVSLRHSNSGMLAAEGNARSWKNFRKMRKQGSLCVLQLVRSEDVRFLLLSL